MQEIFSFAKISNSGADMKKMIKDLRLGYEKIDRCMNDCMLYWGDRKNQDSCHVCGKSRWINRDAENVNADEVEVRSRLKA